MKLKLLKFALIPVDFVLGLLERIGTQAHRLSVYLNFRIACIWVKDITERTKK